MIQKPFSIIFNLSKLIILSSDINMCSGIEIDKKEYTEVGFFGPIAGVHYGYKDKTIQSLKFWTCKDDPKTEFAQPDTQSRERESSSGAIVLPREAEEEKKSAEIAGIVWWQFFIYVGGGLIVLILLILVCLYFCSGEASNLGKSKVDKTIELPEKKMSQLNSKDV